MYKGQTTFLCKSIKIISWVGGRYPWAPSSQVVVLGHRSIPMYQEALCKPWISLPEHKRPSHTAKLCWDPALRKEGSGLQVPSPEAPRIEWGLTAGCPPAEGMLPFSLMSYMKVEKETKWRMKSQNSHNKNVIKVFLFLFKKVLKILNVASLQYILSVLSFSYVSIPAPWVDWSPLVVVGWLWMPRILEKSRVPCVDTGGLPTGGVSSPSPTSNNLTQKLILMLKISIIGVPPLENYKLLSQKDETKRQIWNPWGTFKHLRGSF